MRSYLFVLGLVLAAFPGLSLEAGAPSATFKQYCLGCHGKAAMGGVNLETLLAAPSVGDHYDRWKKVAAALEDRQMPPAKVKQPADAERTEAAQWIRARLKEFALAHNGDPGRVTVRQLTAGEYNYAIEDLTGLRLQLDRDSSADSVGGEGFTNYGDTQFMQDATLERYLESAKRVANHAVIGSGPLGFFIDPGKSGLEYSAIARIRAIYETYGFRASSGEGGTPFNLDYYGRAFAAARRFHDAKGKRTMAEIAKSEKIGREFAEHIYATLQTPNSTYPLSEVIKRFAAKASAKELQDFVVNYPRWVFGAGAWAEGGRGDERNFLITENSLQAKPSGKLRGINRIRAGRGAKFFISVVDLNPAASKQARVDIKDAQIRFTQKDRSLSASMPLLSVLDDAEEKKLGLAAEAGTMNFSAPAGATIPITIKTPDDVTGVGITFEASLSADYPDSVLRVTISDEPVINKGVPFSVILGHDQQPGYLAWKKNVLAFSNAMPQNSHAEATPADKDPIPPPFNNEYNQPERDFYHVRLKYYRDDKFIATKVLDAATRKQLDEAWTDLLGSFEYHDIYFHFVTDKFKLPQFAQRSLASLTSAEIAAIPAEPRGYVIALRKEFDAIQAAKLRAQPGHLMDALSFAEKAWRRPLTAVEKDGLRRFYTNARETMKLDHEKAVRALLARILVSPAFIYRLETNSSNAMLRPVAAVTGGEALLNSYELASRLSFFLWSSIPDAELRRAAQAGELASPAKLSAQVERMLADPKSRRLAPELFGQWLGYYGFDHFTGVDSGRFPEFNAELKNALYEEANSFFDYLVRENRPLREMFTADYTFLNQRLAEHYGVTKNAPQGKELVKVDGMGEYRRGGFLGFGAIHATTSAPLRTSPVKRGNFLLTRVLGTPTPPPPADAGMLPADDRKFGGQTMRERLLAHQRNATCAGCHSRIDPLGFPLENFDPVGRWRDKYGDGQTIYDKGDLRDGKQIPGLLGLKRHLEDKESQVLGNFARKTLGFALGRTVQGSDDPLLEEIAQSGGAQSFADLAKKIANSKQFRYRRAESPTPAAKPMKASLSHTGGL